MTAPNRLRVAIVTETWPPEINGVAQTVHALARGLLEIGHSVELVRPRQKQEADMTEVPAIEQLLLPGGAVPRYPGLRFGLPAMGRLLRRWAVRRPDALYVATEGPLGYSAVAAARRLRVPACTGFHTRFDDYAGHYGAGWLAPTVAAYLRRFHNRAAATLVPTGELASFLTSRGFANVLLLRRAVDTTLFTPARRDDALRARWGLAADDLAMLHVGRIAPEKNVELALRAAAAIRSRHPRARLVVVGDGPERERLAAAHGDVLFAGIRRGEDLARHYASGDLFLFPSASETFGNVTLEALASGLPVVAFDYGAAREHVRDDACGARVALADDDAFVDAAVRVAAREAHSRVPRERVRAAVAGTSVVAVAAQLAELLRAARVEGAA